MMHFSRDEQHGDVVVNSLQISGLSLFDCSSEPKCISLLVLP